MGKGAGAPDRAARTPSARVIFENDRERSSYVCGRSRYGREL